MDERKLWETPANGSQTPEDESLESLVGSNPESEDKSLLRQNLSELALKVKENRELSEDDTRHFVVSRLYIAAMKGKDYQTFWPPKNEYRYPASDVDQPMDGELEIPDFYDTRLFLKGEAKKIYQVLQELGVNVGPSRGFNDDAKEREDRFPIFIEASWNKTEKPE